jgi:hypothetical protein
MRRAARTRRMLAVLAVLALGIAACGGTDGGTDGDAGAAEVVELAVAPASFDLAVGPDRRIVLALFTADRERVVGGEVRIRLGHLGDEAGGEAELGPPITASWLPVPGLDVPAPADGPTVVTGGVLSGVHAARVTLDAPGYWGVLVEARLTDGRTARGRAIVPVLPEPAVVDVGDPAPTATNVTTADVVAGVEPPGALDSRLRAEGVPDRAAALHATRIPDVLAEGRPLVVAIATPVYCQSLVCGPLTDHLVDLASRYGDRAAFVHVEVWRDFEAQELSPAAAAWIRTDAGGNEPWVFLVGADGQIAARWDNVLDTAELEALLAALPVA